MSEITIDESALPLIVVEWPLVVSNADVDAMFDRFDAIYERDEPFVCLLDARFAPLPSPRTLALIARRAGAQDERAMRCSRATAVVTPSPLLRGALNTLFRIYTPATPVRLFEAPRDAREWLLTILGGAPQA